MPLRRGRDVGAIEGRRFDVGVVMLRASVLSAMPVSDIVGALGAHARGEWGAADTDEWIANEMSIRNRQAVVSVHETSRGAYLVIETTADRASTTIAVVDDQGSGPLLRL